MFLVHLLVVDIVAFHILHFNLFTRTGRVYSSSISSPMGFWWVPRRMGKCLRLMQSCAVELHLLEKLGMSETDCLGCIIVPDWSVGSRLVKASPKSVRIGNSVVSPPALLCESRLRVQPRAPSLAALQRSYIAFGRARI